MSEMFPKVLPPNDLNDIAADDDLAGHDIVELPPLDGLSGEDDVDGAGLAGLIEADTTAVDFLDDAAAANLELGLEVGLGDEPCDELGKSTSKLPEFVEGRLFAEDGEGAEDLDESFGVGASLISLLGTHDDYPAAQSGDLGLEGKLAEDEGHEVPALPALGLDDIEGPADSDAMWTDDLQALPPLDSEEAPEVPPELPSEWLEELAELPELDGANDESSTGSTRD